MLPTRRMPLFGFNAHRYVTTGEMAFFFGIGHLYWRADGTTQSDPSMRPCPRLPFQVKRPIVFFQQLMALLTGGPFMSCISSN